MAWLRRAAVAGCAVAALAAALTLTDPSPPEAKANVACDIGSAVTPITGAVGIGNPAGDACNAATDAVNGVLPDPLSPIKDAAQSIGSGIFNQITSWAADGAVWLIGRVAALTAKTTSPNLLSKGFLRQYRRMVSIAAVLAVLMLIFACLEGLGRGDGGMLWRVFLVNVPVAALATSAAYVVVQLLIATTDGFSEVVAYSTASDMHDFFKSVIESLAVAGATAGTTAGGPVAGATAVPLFVGFIAAIVAAFAAFLVWIELLMRDAAIYAVALFMPLAIAASIWPRWMGALRRTGELVIVVVFSKFVIISIIALAASLLANTGGKVEHVLAAGALMLLACFAPFVLFRLVPFAEGAVSSAFNRQSAGGASVRTVEFASSVQMMRRAALANWAVNSTKGKDGSAADAGGGGGAGAGGGGSAGGGRAKAKPGGGSGGGGAGGSAGAGQAGGASGGAAGAVALPVAAGVGAAKGSQAAAGKLASSGTSQASGANGASGGVEAGGAAQGGSQEAAARPPAEQGASGGDKAAAKTGSEGEGGNGEPSSPKASSAPEPREAGGGEAGRGGAKPPRPGGDVGAAGKGGGAAGAAKP